MSTDFFDEDLSAAESARTGKTARQEPAKAAEEPAGGRMARHRDEVSGQVAGRMSELERLRQRQEEIEREKANLESLSRKQEEYEKGKQDVIEKLDRSILLLENEEVQATRMVELLSSMRARFKDMLAELRAIDEERWADETFNAELSKALAVVEDARMAYKKGLAKIEASRWPEGGEAKGPAYAVDALPPEEPAQEGFAHWLKAGIAFTLPLAVVIIVLYLVHLVMTGAR